MKKLDETLSISGTGIRGLTATLVLRTKNKAMYKRTDGYYEVFLIRTSKAGEVFGKELPDREVYPGNEDFGRTAWCIDDEKRAMMKYESLL